MAALSSYLFFSYLFGCSKWTPCCSARVGVAFGELSTLVRQGAGRVLPFYLFKMDSLLLGKDRGRMWRACPPLSAMGQDAFNLPIR